jgi:hypothetical protein
LFIHHALLLVEIAIRTHHANSNGKKGAAAKVQQAKEGQAKIPKADVFHAPMFFKSSLFVNPMPQGWPLIRAMTLPLQNLSLGC